MTMISMLGEKIGKNWQKRLRTVLGNHPKHTSLFHLLSPQTTHDHHTTLSADPHKMSEIIRFDNQVCIVTGAGAGIGRAHAILFGARGASVVVNDMNPTAAESTVQEIISAGGIAIADIHSVVHGAKVVQTAIDTYGRIDIIVNNAGILRDVSFAKMKEEQWDLVYEVHCKGTKSICKAAWPYMREQKYGRIINTTSVNGLFGAVGQANYSFAKAGIIGFTYTLAQEGK